MTEILSLPVIVAKDTNGMAFEDINYVELTASKATSSAYLTLSPSTSNRDVVLRSSHDLKNNTVEEIDSLPTIGEKSLNTSTPLASPSISTIIRNIEAENLSFSNVTHLLHHCV